MKYPEDAFAKTLQRWYVSYVLDDASYSVEWEGFFWAATMDFIKKYNSPMSSQTLAVVATCFSAYGCDGFLDIGFDICGGWDEKVDGIFMGESAQYLFECMFGEQHSGDVTGAYHFNPPMRPMTLLEARSAADVTGLIVEPDPPHATFTIVSDPANMDIALRPSVTAAARSGNALVLEGQFGSEEGEVHLNGSKQTVTSWQARRIYMDLPGGGQTGEVVVIAANGKTSNPVRLARYEMLATIHVTHPWYSGTVTVSGNYVNAAGAFLDAETLDLMPVTRSIVFDSNATLSWDLQGYYATEESIIATASNGSRQLGDQEFWFKLSSGGVLFSSTAFIPIEHSVTDLESGGTSVIGGSCNLVTPLLAATSAYDVETGVITEGACTWTALGLQQNVLTIPECHPSPAVNLSNPR